MLEEGGEDFHEAGASKEIPATLAISADAVKASARVRKRDRRSVVFIQYP